MVGGGQGCRRGTESAPYASLAFTLGVLIVTAVYLLVSFAFLSVVTIERIVSNTAFVAQFGEALFRRVGGKSSQPAFCSQCFEG
jgi:hypothetical protein